MVLHFRPHVDLRRRFLLGSAVYVAAMAPHLWAPLPAADPLFARPWAAA